jgi:hypothetical protein
MDKVNNTLKISEYVSLSQLRKKIKLYFVDIGYGEYKPSIYSQGLVLLLVMVIEEMLSDSLKDVTKHDTTGLYLLTPMILRNLISESNKYDFALKYIKKYNSSIKYGDSVFFNIKKVLDGLESKYGSKLMIEYETRNLLSYIIVSLQYDLLKLALILIEYANKKTLNLNVLYSVSNFVISQEISLKIKLKLDSTNVEITDDEEKDVTEDEEAEVEAEAEEVEVEPEVEEVEVEEVKVETKVIKEEVNETEEFQKIKGKKNKKNKA